MRFGDPCWRLRTLTQSLHVGFLSDGKMSGMHTPNLTTQNSNGMLPARTLSLLQRPVFTAVCSQE